MPTEEAQTLRARTFIKVNYHTAINLTVRLGDCVSPDHLARCMVDVIALRDLTAISARYGPRGAPAYAPEILLGLLFYGYATGVCSTRQIEQATYESLPFRCIAGDMPPDHDPLAHFRKTFLAEITTLFAQVLLSAYEAGVLKLGAMSLEGTQMHADASKSKAVSDNRLIESEAHLRKEGEDLMALGGRAEQGEPLPEGRVISEESVRRHERRTSLAEAKAVIEARAEARDRADHIADEAKRREREEKVRPTGRTPRGRPPSPPTPGARDHDQYTCTDPASQRMKNSTNQGFDQHDNAPIAPAQDSLLLVGHALANPANDPAEVAPT
jgi:transposase